MPQTLPTAVGENLEYEDFYESTLSLPLNAADTDIYPVTMPISVESFLVIDPEGSAPEIIFYNDVGADYVRCPSATDGQGRGVFNTSPQDWEAGTKIGMYSTAAFFEAIVTGRAMRSSFFAPTAAVIPYAGPTAPDGWLLCFGQSLLRADYPDLFDVIGTTYGAADGTHFSMPDLRGRVPAGQDDMGGSSANRLTSPINGDTLGEAGGAESFNNAHTHSGTTNGMSALAPGVAMTAGAVDINHAHTYTTSSSGSATQTIVQPTIILNYIIKT